MQKSQPCSRFTQLVVTLSLLIASLAPPALGGAPVSPGWIVVYPAFLEPALRDQGVEIWSRDGQNLIAGAGDDQIAALAGQKLEPSVKIQDDGQWMYLLVHPEEFTAPHPTQAKVYALSATTDLYLFPGDQRVDLPLVGPRAGFMAVPRLPMSRAEVHAADLAPGLEQTEAVNPLVTDIVNATSQANWIQYIKDISGENPVTVGGVSRTILTRYSDAMFPTPASNAYATEYLLEKGASWGYEGVRESYTSAQSGCSQGTWQNVVFTLPGQVDFGQHQQVIFVTHYDSLSYNITENFNYAPGADDAMSGGAALIEALRLFKDYAFRNTVKIIFFSGEEEGLCGSEAYTRQHPSADMWRVVNMDQTAYDGDKNGVMNLYNWSLANSPASVALGNLFVQANSDYGPIINPAKIVRNTSFMCQTDHCPFWLTGVAAIDLNEDFTNNDFCPCFDQLQTATCHDTVTQMDPNHPGQLLFDQDYSWPTQKASIATVAVLAEPLYACPLSAPTPALVPGNNVLHLSWPSASGVTNYVIEKASSCAGPFTAVASVGGTTYDDLQVANGTTYAYRVRTCPTQTSACVSSAPVPGPSVVYQGGSAAVIADSGDHDNVPDNCELVTVQVNLSNDGNQDLTNVKLGAVTSSHAGVQVATAVPQSLGGLLVGESKPASFQFYLGRNGTPAACGETLPFTVTATSSESSSSVRNFSFTAERDSIGGTLTYGFETDYSGWTVTSGTFARIGGGAPGSTAFSVRGANVNLACNAIVSPVVVPQATSTMTMYVNFGIETPPQFDRAVVRAINTTTGAKTLLVPTGAPYNTTGSAGGLCDGIGSLQGWAGSAVTWRQASFNLSSFAGIPIQIEVRFSTDTNTLGPTGFWFDAVQITNATQVICDAQSNSCIPLPAEVSPTGSPAPLLIAKSGLDYQMTFSEVSGAATYNVYAGTLASLQAGAYDHGASAGLCGFTDASPGDGQVSIAVAGGALPENAYFLAVAKGSAGESVYGTSGSGGVIPIALSACP